MEKRPKRRAPKKLRACLNCCQLKSSSEFRSVGCENCPFLGMKNNAEAVSDCTSDSYRGMIAINESGKSWVAKWQRLNGVVKGIYAITVNGELPDYYIDRAERAGKVYYPRDTPFQIN